MKIVCLVPSITETLIAADINLVGRSRFCIHPESQVSQIPKVGGTKDVDWSKVTDLKAELVILDKEENTLEMAESCPIDYFALHITHINDVAPELLRLAKFIKSQKLKQIAKRWQTVSLTPQTQRSIEQIPGLIQWWKKPTTQKSFEYLIWKNPWMAIGNHTFIQSVLDFCGLKNFRVKHSEKYPSISLDSLSKEETMLLFSSEPFPFERHRESVENLGFACALIDGELFSWYGIRSLNFLESLN